MIWWKSSPPAAATGPRHERFSPAPRFERIQPSPTTAAAQRARDLAAAGRPIIRLTTGEPDFATPDHVIEAAHAAMRRGETKYPPVAGVPALKQAAADKFRRDNGLDYALDEIFIGHGAKQILFNTLMASLGPGDEVIVPAPYWGSYPEMVRLAAGEAVIVTTEPQHGFKLTPEQLEQAIGPKTRWLMLNSPSNPAGALYSAAELKALDEVLVRQPQVWVLSDDIYEHIVFDDRSFTTMAQIVPELKARTLTLNGVSKAYAMTGWRIGFAGGPAPLIAAITKLQSQSTSGANSIGQAAAIAALNGPQEQVQARTAEFQSRRDAMVELINAVPAWR